MLTGLFIRFLVRLSILVELELRAKRIRVFSFHRPTRCRRLFWTPAV